jgi:hypothetical protein
MAEKKNKNGTSKPVSKPVTAPKLTKTLQDRLKAARKTGQSALVKTRRKAASTGEKIRANTGPVLKKIAAGLGNQSQQSGKAIGSFYANQLQPKLVLLRGWIAKRMHPGSLVRDYHRLVLLIHKLGPDRTIENLCFVSTSMRTPLSIVRVPHQLRRSGHDYRPTPRLVFKWTMEALPESIERYEFVDYGAGRGRVLLMASQHPFEKITGAEIAEEFHNDCILNIAQFPRSLMKCRDVSCEHLSALRLKVPDQETVFFLNNPFNRDMLERVISQIARSYRQDTRRFYLICVDIADQEIVMDTGIFEEVKIPWQQKLKISACSPYSINLYRTVI